MKYEFVDYEQEGPVVIIRMNRHERRNSESWELTRDLNTAFERFENDDSARIVILTGVGTSFCAGADLKDRVEMFKLTKEERAKFEKKRMEEMPTTILRRLGDRDSMISKPIIKPIIAAVNGYAIGGGFLMAMGCDLVVAAESATFQLPEIARGSSGAAGTMSSQMIPFHIGLEICLGAKLTAQRAYEIGMVNKVVPDNQLMPAAMEMAKGICELPPLPVKHAVEVARRLTFWHLHPSEVAAIKREVEVIRKSEDYVEGFTAAREKRKPVWKGR